MRRRVRWWVCGGLAPLAPAFCGAAGAVSASSGGRRTPLASAVSPSVTTNVTSTAPGAAPLGTTNYPSRPAPTSWRRPVRTRRRARWPRRGRRSDTRWRAAPNHATIVMRAGIYREPVMINSKALTIQPYPERGRDRAGFECRHRLSCKSGTTWVLENWNYQFPRQTSNASTAQHPLANAPDQVFVDGSPLTQVAKATRVNGRVVRRRLHRAHARRSASTPPGTRSRRRRRCSACDLERASGTVVRGIQFDEYATPRLMHGAVLDKSGGAVFENDFFLNNAIAGLSVQGPEHARHARHDGQQRPARSARHQADHLHVTGCELRQNNTELFDEHQEAGGMKSASSNDVRGRQQPGRREPRQGHLVRRRVD